MTELSASRTSTIAPRTGAADTAVLPEVRRARMGFVYALGAYLSWGFVPAYFKLLAHVPPIVVLAHRIVWSVLFLAILLTLQRKWGEVKAAVSRRQTLLVLVCSTVLIAINWFVFIWAVTNDRLLQASLGYFINPLVNVLLGVLILRERLRPGQVAALLLAVAGVLELTRATGGVPWVALTLACSFSLYALLRKVAPVGPLAGLSVETAILFPAALLIVAGWLPARFDLPLGGFSGGTYALLATAGVITAVPLLLFAAGARRLRLSTLGFIQYLAPTCQFLLAVLVYHEPFSSGQLLSFSLIWAALALYTLETVWHLHRARSGALASEMPVAMPE